MDKDNSEVLVATPPETIRMESVRGRVFNLVRQALKGPSEELAKSKGFAELLMEDQSSSLFRRGLSGAPTIHEASQKAADQIQALYDVFEYLEEYPDAELPINYSDPTHPRIDLIRAGELIRQKRQQPT